VCHAHRQAKADAMVAKWRHDFCRQGLRRLQDVGSPERIVIADIDLGSDGLLFSVPSIQKWSTAS